MKVRLYGGCGRGVKEAWKSLNEALRDVGVVEYAEMWSKWMWR